MEPVARNPEPIVELVERLRAMGFEVTSATQELASSVPLMRIETPDRSLSFIVSEADYFADPDRVCRQIEHHLRHLGFNI